MLLFDEREQRGFVDDAGIFVTHELPEDGLESGLAGFGNFPLIEQAHELGDDLADFWDGLFLDHPASGTFRAVVTHF